MSRRRLQIAQISQIKTVATLGFGERAFFTGAHLRSSATRDGSMSLVTSAATLSWREWRALPIGRPLRAGVREGIAGARDSGFCRNPDA